MTYLQIKDADLLLYAHIQPGAKSTAWVGVYGERIKIRLCAPPVDGRANEFLCAWLAKQFNCMVRDVTVLRGETSRQKTVKISGAASGYEAIRLLINQAC